MGYVSREGYNRGDPVRLLAPFASDSKVQSEAARHAVRLWVSLGEAIPVHAEPAGQPYEHVHDDDVCVQLSALQQRGLGHGELHFPVHFGAL